MEKNNLRKLILLVFSVFLLSGCATALKDSDNKVVKNTKTGQQLYENILCQPENEEIRTLYEENNVDVNGLPKCKNFSIGSGGYEGLWTSVIIKPLAWVIIQFGNILSNYGLGLIITSLLIRLIAFPLSKKTAMQSELMNDAKPKLDRLEKKYEGKTDQESLMKKQQEMLMIYKEYNINPISGCIFALIQIPLFIGFLEAINRVPAIFEESLLGFQLGTTPMTGLTGGNYLYILLTIIVGVSTFFSLKLNSSSNPNNEQMKMMSRIMLIVILFTSLFMTSALNIYWITTNLFTVVQNLLVKRKKERI